MFTSENINTGKGVIPEFKGVSLSGLRARSRRAQDPLVSAVWTVMGSTIFGTRDSGLGISWYFFLTNARDKVNTTFLLTLSTKLLYTSLPIIFTYKM